MKERTERVVLRVRNVRTAGRKTTKSQVWQWIEAIRLDNLGARRLLDLPGFKRHGWGKRIFGNSKKCFYFSVFLLFVRPVLERD